MDRHREQATGIVLPVWAICGPGRCGKDHGANFLASITPMRFAGSTSRYLHPYVVERTGMDPQECWDRRHQMRQLWYDLGNELRRDDPLVLLRASIDDRNTLIAGCRDREEIEAALDCGLIDLAIWIDRDVPPDPTMTYGPEVCDVIIPNRWGLFEYERRLRRFVAQTRVPLLAEGLPCAVSA